MQTKRKFSTSTSVFRPATCYVDSSVTGVLRAVTDLSHAEVSLSEVTHCLNRLDAPKADSPDGILSRLLTECSNQIAPSSCAIFNQILCTGQIPKDWKSADLTSTHTKNSKGARKNYRPISLLPIVSKVVERLVFNRLNEHLKNVITHLQDGF